MKLSVILASGLLGVTVLLSQAGEGRSRQGGVIAGRARVPTAVDTLVRAAEVALAQGRPWRATEIISVVMADPLRRTPAASIVAARAAAGWRGWSEVARVLERAEWLDTLFNGDGRALLARSLLAMGRDSAAAAHAAMAVNTSPNDAERGRRVVLLARTRSAINDNQGASAAYLQGAQLAPAASDWLILRAAEWIADSAARAITLAGLTLPHAVSRAANVDAVASENTGDTVGAIGRYMRQGNRIAAYRLRLAIASSAGDSAALRSDLVAAIGSGSGARAFVDLLDVGFRAVSAEEDLAIARALGAGGGARGVQSYRRAMAAGLGNSNDRFQYASILARLGENAQAIQQFAQVTSPPALAAAAAYQRARTMLRSDAGLPWRDALQAVVRDFPSDTSAGTALYLLADLATDEGRDADAREAFLSSARRYPANSRAATAMFHAGMISYVLGDYAAAAQDFDALRSTFPRSAEVTAAIYWRGRSLSQSGSSSGMSDACSRIRAVDSMSYYAALCARRSFPAFVPPVAALDTFLKLPQLDSVAARVSILRSLEMDTEVNLELDRIRTLAAGSAEQLLSAANTFRELGEGSRAVSAAQAAMNAGVRRDARLYRLLYPSTFLDMVGIEASLYNLDLDLIAGLIRQESLFNPAATSPVGARGLMQVMPALGSQLAQAFNFPLWDPVLLWQPDVNARLGVRHFSDLVSSQAHVYHVLASYNAGANRVERWLTKRGSNDPEVFVDRIPFVETRDYVRIVARNSETYKGLYER